MLKSCHTLPQVPAEAHKHRLQDINRPQVTGHDSCSLAQQSCAYSHRGATGPCRTHKQGLPQLLAACGTSPLQVKALQETAGICCYTPIAQCMTRAQLLLHIH